MTSCLSGTMLMLSQNFKYLRDKPIRQMVHAPQFLQMLTAEAAQLVSISIHLAPSSQSAFEQRLNDAFSSDNYSEVVKLWNDERELVVKETLDKHLLIHGVKWAREWLREECEASLAKSCAEELRRVRQSN